jgi:hypothetical protein
MRASVEVGETSITELVIIKVDLQKLLRW